MHPEVYQAEAERARQLFFKRSLQARQTAVGGEEVCGAGNHQEVNGTARETAVQWPVKKRPTRNTRVPSPACATDGQRSTSWPNKLSEFRDTVKKARFSSAQGPNGDPKVLQGTARKKPLVPPHPSPVGRTRGGGKHHVFCPRLTVRRGWRWWRQKGRG